MTLFYTLGGGWGHLRRVQVFIENEGIIDYKVLTSNPLAERLFRKEDIIICKNATVGELPDHMAFFHAVLGKYSITELYVDVFPQGIMGELSMLSPPLIFSPMPTGCLQRVGIISCRRQKGIETNK